MTEATCAAAGSSALDQAGAQQLINFVALLKNLIKRQRHMYLSSVLNWKRQIDENDRLQQFYDMFRCTPECYKKADDLTKNRQEKLAFSLNAKANASAAASNQ